MGVWFKMGGVTRYAPLFKQRVIYLGDVSEVRRVACAEALRALRRRGLVFHLGLKKSYEPIEHSTERVAREATSHEVQAPTFLSAGLGSALERYAEDLTR